MSLKLHAILALTQAVENLSEAILNLPDEANSAAPECEGCNECDQGPELPQFIRDLPAQLLSSLNQIREDEDREEDQTERLTRLEQLFGLDNLSKGNSNEQAQSDEILDGIETALQKILGPSLKIRRIYP